MAASVSSRQKRRRIQQILVNGSAFYQEDAEQYSSANQSVTGASESNSDQSDILHNNSLQDYCIAEVVDSDMNHSDTEPDSDSDDEIYVDCEEETETCYEVEEDDTFFDCEEHNINTCEFRESLASWAVQCQIPQSHVDKLLVLLKSFSDFDTSNLPKSCRTLLKTIRRTATKVVGPGHYYHCGVEKGILSTLQRMQVKRIPSKRIKLLINVDGVPIAKSSGSQFWPILGRLSGFPHSKPFLIGIYHGPSKPSDANVFLADFTTEILDLLEKGILYNGEVLTLVIFGFVCDAPARAFIAYTKTHSGYFSCSKCTEEGDFEGRIVFLNEKAPLRTDATFRSQRQDEHHTGRSILEQLPIDMVATFPLDYMHLCCLGVMRKLLWQWIKGPLSCRLSQTQKNTISSFLIFLASYIPSEFSRKSRSLAELARWKATELREFLLYTGPIVLKNVLPKRLYEHFLLFHVAVKLLVAQHFCKEFNDYAKQLLVLFVTEAKEIYGKEFLSYNVHNLIHLADDVRHFGNLDSFSAFAFENYLQDIKHLLRKHNQPLAQVIRRLDEIQLNLVPRINCAVSPFVLKKKHTQGPMINGCRGVQFKFLQCHSWTFRTDNDADCCAILQDQTIVKIANLLKSEEGIFLVGHSFLHKTSHYSSPLPSSRLGIVCARRLSQLQRWPIKSLKCKAMLLPTAVHSLYDFAVFPLHMQSNA